jgi:hypothetical protein
MRSLFLPDSEAVLLASRERTVQLRTAHTALRTERLVNRDAFAGFARDVAREPEAIAFSPALVALSMLAGFGFAVGIGSLFF